MNFDSTNFSIIFFRSLRGGQFQQANQFMQQSHWRENEGMWYHILMPIMLLLSM